MHVLGRVAVGFPILSSHEGTASLLLDLYLKMQAVPPFTHGERTFNIEYMYVLKTALALYVHNWQFKKLFQWNGPC